MKSSAQSHGAFPVESSSARSILGVAAWLGLVCGIIEGVGLLSLQRFGWLNWDMAQMGVWYEILWIAPFFDLLYFVLLGLLFLPLARFIPVKWRLQFSVFSFSFLMFLDWGLLSGKIRHSAALVLAIGLATVASRSIQHGTELKLLFLRKSLTALVALGLLLGVVVTGLGWIMERQQIASLPPAQPGAPNILIIVMDTVRADHLSTFGYARQTSPHIDRIAQQGVLFERAFSASSWTLPSHASLLTGRFPHEHGATEAGSRYDGRFPTLPEALWERGYRTAAFSANLYLFTRSHGFGKGFHHFEDFFGNFEDMAIRTVYGRQFQRFVLQRKEEHDIPGRKLAEDINRSLLLWLERTASRPFFAILNYMDAHDPYLPPQPFRNRFSKTPNPGGKVNGTIGMEHPSLTPKQIQSEMDAYDGGIAYADAQIGDLMIQLATRGLLENTIVVITSDHGESFGEHGLMSHRNALYRNLIHVPLVIYAPGRVPSGLRVSTPVSNVALPVTLMELLGATAQSVFPGPTLVDLWKTPEADSDYPYPLAELNQMPFSKLRNSPAFHGVMQSLVSPKLQYIHNEKLGDELFDWGNDPQQLNNLAKTSSGQLQVSEFGLLLREAVTGKARSAKHELPGSGK